MTSAAIAFRLRPQSGALRLFIGPTSKRRLGSRAVGHRTNIDRLKRADSRLSLRELQQTFRPSFAGAAGRLMELGERERREQTRPQAAFTANGTERMAVSRATSLADRKGPSNDPYGVFPQTSSSPGEIRAL